MPAWISRDEALTRLGVRPQTLYAYVSRGRIGMQPDPADPRRSLYRTDDIAQLITRRGRGRRASAIAESAMTWGEPAIATSISTVVHGRLVYRGEDACTLSGHMTLEETAGLLWADSEPVVFAPKPGGTASEGGRAEAFSALALLAANGQPSLGRSPARLHADAAAAIGGLATSLGALPGSRPVHMRLAEAWSVRNAGADAIRRALVLLADHELNTSTFAARVAASTGAPLAACLLAGLSALCGPRHGGAAEAAVTVFLDDAVRLGAADAVALWLTLDRPLYGFGHPLYPDGDPRAKALLAAVECDEAVARLRDAVFAATGRQPDIDFALVALTRAFRLPPDAPFRLFALGRSVGWAAHAMEQALTGGLIRPRARYEGPPPVDEDS
ncbi:citrate synthase [Mesorhizobium albiziae]|uniref:citrate synthase (unknown stereospecificity) n=1 Tax=Neomesorhizobium albiziae TaxID=335020 RepID=A0A1I4B484_9HYPH|nr:citrate synthase [Mesorhizobium albiziae]GLS34276.1 citrate synthase [Mesorhizobium albiziae]SFK62861.1 citrate synthase [Mesorhizobium albiziae]